MKQQLAELRKEDEEFIQAQADSLVKDRDEQEKRVLAAEKERDDLVLKYTVLEEQVRHLQKIQAEKINTEQSNFRTPAAAAEFTTSSSFPPHPLAKREVKAESPPAAPHKEKHNSPPFFSITSNTGLTIPELP